VRQIWLRYPTSGLVRRRPPQLQRLSPDDDPGRYEFPVSSPDGSRVYAIRTSEFRLLTYEPARREFVPYLGGISAFAVAFSPDRQSVAYIRIPDHTVWRARADGSQSRQLTFSPWHVDGLAWRPDGQQLAIRARQENAHHTKVYLLAANGGVPEPIDRDDVEQGSPTWSRDGSQLAFGDVPESYAKATGGERISIHDLRTGTERAVEGSEGFWSSRWSPDGRFLAATRIADRMLMLYSFETGDWKDLGVRYVGEFTWAPDSLSIHTEPEPLDGWRRRVWIRDGRQEPLLDVRNLHLHFGAGLALDGRPLVLRAQTDVFTLHLDVR